MKVSLNRVLAEDPCIGRPAVLQLWGDEPTEVRAEHFVRRAAARGVKPNDILWCLMYCSDSRSGMVSIEAWRSADFWSPHERGKAFYDALARELEKLP